MIDDDISILGEGLLIVDDGFGKRRFPGLIYLFQVAKIFEPLIICFLNPPPLDDPPSPSQSDDWIQNSYILQLEDKATNELPINKILECVIYLSTYQIYCILSTTKP